MFKLDEPNVGEKEIEYVTEAIKSGWISSHGSFVKKFEKMFADYTGVKYAVSCFSGTSALMLMYATLKLQKGDEIILPSLTFTANAWALVQSGAKVVFADCGDGKYTLSPEDVKKRITNKTKVIFPTHLYGYPAELDELKEICEKRNILLIEDCCQATGSRYKDKMVGSIGDFNIHSFHNKLIASGEGGMVTTNNKELAERFHSLKNPPSVNRPEERNNFSEIAMNHRMSNLHAAVGVAQLEKLEEGVKKKIRMANLYNQQFQDSEEINIFKANPQDRTVYWRYSVFVDEKINLKSFIKEAMKTGIATRETFLPLHLHPFFKNQYKISLPNCEKIGRTGLDIPSSINLSENDIIFISKKLKEIARKLISSKN